MADHLLVEKQGHIVVVTMNRPDARNAISSEMMVRLADAWDLVDGDPEVRVAILTGAAGHFSSGADLKDMAGNRAETQWTARLKADGDLHWKAFLRHYRLKKPLIAAVEGTAVAGGTEILQATDIRVAGQSAKFGVAEARWGLFPLGGSTVRLRRQIPYTIAMDLLLTGRLITAEEALRIGLIGRVVADGKALDEAKQIAEQIAANGPLAVQAIKRSVMETEGLPEREALKKELEIGWPILSTEDAKEGPRAFSEKRKPDFKGR
jgi:enoyl-CoA hydratase